METVNQDQNICNAEFSLSILWPLLYLKFSEIQKKVILIW